MAGVHVTISDVDFPDVREVDLKLIELARTLRGEIVTNDFNLNKVAQLRGVDVLNINELANALKPVVLPGEFMKVFILKEGKEYNQGVAYLDDGTMVVVDNARRLIGRNIDVVVTSVLQTTAGKMIFGRHIDAAGSGGDRGAGSGGHARRCPTRPPAAEKPDGERDGAGSQAAARAGVGRVLTCRCLRFHWWRTVFFLIPAIAVYTIVLGTVSLVSALVRSTADAFAHRCARLWSWLILATTGVEVDVSGLERLDPRSELSLRGQSSEHLRHPDPVLDAAAAAADSGEGVARTFPFPRLASRADGPRARRSPATRAPICFGGSAR